MRRVGKGLLRWGLIAACAALVLPGVCAARAESVRVTVAPTPITRPIAPGFLGLAFEYSSIPGWVGPDLARPNPVLVRLIRNLDPTGRPVIRIGGLSTDHSWWPVPGMAEPKGITYALGPRWAASMAALARALDAQLVLGVNLEADSARLARTEADEFLTTIGRRYVSALDLGNEPPLYRGIPWYRVRNGQVIPWYEDAGTEVFGRSLSWGPSTFITDYAQLLAALPRVPILGPDTQQATWFAAYKRFVSPHSRVRILASHGYGLNNCVTRPESAAYPTIGHLLSSYALHDLLADLTPYIGVAHANGAQFRIDEMGSITCNGRWGVSNTMASALWAAAALFSVAQDHVDGVNLHSYTGLSNALFDFTDTEEGWTGAVHPLYYGALLFAHAAPAGSRLLRVLADGPPTLHAWATTGPGATRHVVLINDSVTGTARVTVRALHGALGGGPAQLERLTAPSAAATSGITLGGRTFGSGTTTATLRPPVRDVSPARAGGYRIAVPAASAVTLTLVARSRR
jgi:hypothetical protein